MSLIQFFRLRRGVPEVVNTVDIDGDASAALAEGSRLVRRGRWPARADGLRAVDDCGRTIMNWSVPFASDEAPSIRLAIAPKSGTADELRMPLPGTQVLQGDVLAAGSRHFDVGQPVSYADDDQPDLWKGGYEIIGLCDPEDPERQYVIRNANDSYNLIVQEHELREDLGARHRGR
jgi:hypothetical protein